MRTIVITGSTKGIGKAIGIKFLKQGYYVIFNYAQDDEACRLLREEIKIYDGNYEVIKNDFSDEKAIDDFVNQLKKHKIDKLVLNAGITNRTSWTEMSMEQWNHVMYVNLTVPAFLIQKLGKQMCMGGVYCA